MIYKFVLVSGVSKVNVLCVYIQPFPLDSVPT